MMMEIVTRVDYKLYDATLHKKNNNSLGINTCFDIEYMHIFVFRNY